MTFQKITAEEIAEAGLATYDVAVRWDTALNNAMAKYEINRPRRQAAFLATCSHESGGFKRLEENLNYSVSGLRQTFPKYFDEAVAQLYARNPQKIANRAYAHRMGNGDEKSGDGWKYRGRGLIQLTGKANYRAYNEHAVDDPAMLVDPLFAADSAGWFWKQNGCNALADSENLVGLRRRVNGGSIGLQEFERLYHQMLAVIKADAIGG